MMRRYFCQSATDDVLEVEVDPNEVTFNTIGASACLNEEQVANMFRLIRKETAWVLSNEPSKLWEDAE